MTHDFVLRVRREAKMHGRGHPNGDEDEEDFQNAILHHKNRLSLHDSDPESRQVISSQGLISQAELDLENRESIRVRLGWAALGLMTHGHANAIAELVQNMYFDVWQMGYVHKMPPSYMLMMVPALSGMHFGFGREDIEEVVVWLERNESYLLWDAEAGCFQLSDNSPDGYFRRWRKRTPERDINTWRYLATIFAITSHEVDDTLPERLELQYHAWLELLSHEDSVEKRNTYTFRIAWAALGLMTYGRKDFIEVAVEYLPLSEIGNKRDMPEAIVQMVPAFDTKTGWNIRQFKTEALAWVRRNIPYLHWDAAQWQYILSDESPDGLFHAEKMSDDH